MVEEHDICRFSVLHYDLNIKSPVLIVQCYVLLNWLKKDHTIRYLTLYLETGYKNPHMIMLRDLFLSLRFILRKSSFRACALKKRFTASSRIRDQKWSRIPTRITQSIKQIDSKMKKEGRWKSSPVIYKRKRIYLSEHHQPGRGLVAIRI